MSSEFVVVGEVVRAHGVRGALRVRATGETLATLPVGAELHDARPDGGASVLRVSGPLRGGIMTFEGVDDRDAATALVGTLLSVPVGVLPPVTAADTFYVRDLIGCTVVVGGHPLGPVVEVLERPANDVLEVRAGDGAIRLLPFTRDAVVSIDLAARTIVLRDDLLTEDESA